MSTLRDFFLPKRPKNDDQGTPLEHEPSSTEPEDIVPEELENQPPVVEDQGTDPVEEQSADPTNTGLGNAPVEDAATVQLREDLQVEKDPIINQSREYVADIGDAVGKETFSDKELKMFLSCWTQLLKVSFPPLSTERSQEGF